MLRKVPQTRRQLAHRTQAQLLHCFGRERVTPRGALLNLGALALNPRPLLLREQLGVAAGSPSRQGDADTAVGPDANHVPSSFRVADEFHETMTIVPRHSS